MNLQPTMGSNAISLLVLQHVRKIFPEAKLLNGGVETKTGGYDGKVMHCSIHTPPSHIDMDLEGTCKYVQQASRDVVGMFHDIMTEDLLK